MPQRGEKLRARGPFPDLDVQGNVQSHEERRCSILGPNQSRDFRCGRPRERQKLCLLPVIV